MIERFEEELAAFRNQLVTHPLYRQIDRLKSIQLLMEAHVFAVWDFMSLVKKLQQDLTSTALPWTPSAYPEAGRLINEIVWGEETDINRHGQVQSHFEMYRDAMQNIGASTEKIDDFIDLIRSGVSLTEALNRVEVPAYVQNFLNFTFEIIHTNKTHLVAAVFTFGREDLIPDMFIEMVKTIQSEQSSELLDLVYYLERHIELDGDEHGPLAIQMIEKLCENDPSKIDEAIEAARKALQMRIQLWDGIHSTIEKQLLINA